MSSTRRYIPSERPPHPAGVAPDDLLKDCTVARGRSGGPGGQRRNKVETHVTITHGPTGIIAQAGERRDVKDNKRVALRRLRLTLATEHREPVPAGDCRSARWRSRTPGGKIVCSVKHADFPAMLAEAMDVLAACCWDTRKACVRLEVSATQLVRFVADHPPAFTRMNDSRVSLGLRRLSR